MLIKLQNFLLQALYPARKLAWPLLILGALAFPGMILLAAIKPDLQAEVLYTGWVAALAILMLGVLLAMSRPEPPPNEGFRNRLLRFWETLVFAVWLICLAIFLSLAVKIITFSG